MFDVFLIILVVVFVMLSEVFVKPDNNIFWFAINICLLLLCILYLCQRINYRSLEHFSDDTLKRIDVNVFKEFAELPNQLYSVLKPGFSHLITALNPPDTTTTEENDLSLNTNDNPVEAVKKIINELKYNIDENTVNDFVLCNNYLHALKGANIDEYTAILKLATKK